MPAPSVIIIRNPSTDDGTFGKLIVHRDGLPSVSWYSGELPWHDNKPNVSCVATGTYFVQLEYSEHFKKKLLELRGVKGRTECKFHPANYCGDVAKSKKSELLGCIALGKRLELDADGQMSLVCSGQAIKEFMKTMGGECFMLTIMDKGIYGEQYND